MHHNRVLTVLVTLFALVLAWNPPSYKGYTRKWSTNFIGKADASPGTGTWNLIARDNNYNNEFQRYSTNKRNLRLSGSGTLQLIPQKDSTAPKGWTSSRIESKYTFTPTSGRITRIEAALRLGGNNAKYKQGIWPAFWVLGESSRRGVKWPTCGEVDIMENVSGQKTVYGAAHCDKSPGGICEEPNGVNGQVTHADANYHVWRVDYNRKSSQYKDQSITWYKDGKQFHRVTGSQINNEKVWKTLCQSPMFVILNVAVGGYWVRIVSQDKCHGLLIFDSLVHQTPRH